MKSYFVSYMYGIGNGGWGFGNFIVKKLEPINTLQDIKAIQEEIKERLLEIGTKVEGNIIVINWILLEE
jgi:hypothetical protein